MKKHVLIVLCSVLLIGCQRSPGSEAATPTNRLARAEQLLDELNDWDTDQLALSEERDADSNQVPSGETNGWIAAHEAELEKLGFKAIWNAQARRFELAEDQWQGN